MKWFRKIEFRKRAIEEENNYYKIVDDTQMIAFILERINYYDLKVLKIDFCDFYTCSIKLWGDKQLFLRFTKDFVEHYQSYIKDISF
jgi:hypothetical protein